MHDGHSFFVQCLLNRYGQTSPGSLCSGNSVLAVCAVNNKGESNVACSKTWQWMPGLNCGIGCSEAQPACDADAAACASFYECQFPAMVADWREKFRGSGSPISGRPRGFLFVELAPYTEGSDGDNHLAVALIRQAQLAALRLPHTGMAAAFDYGDTASPLGNIHPRFVLKSAVVVCEGTGMPYRRAKTH